MQHAPRVQVVDAFALERNSIDGVCRVDQGNPLRIDAVQGQSLARHLQSFRGNINSDNLSGTGIDGKPDDIISRPAPVVEDSLAVMTSVKIHKLSEEGIKLGPPF